MNPTYDRIGEGYSSKRAPDPRIERQIVSALGDATSVINVGAGAGSYEPLDRNVVAVEPSAKMIAQRRTGSSPVVRATAEALPIVDDAADAALAILTLHHWNDKAKGLAEMRRVARKRIVILTWDADVWLTFWLVREYGESIREADRKVAVPIPDIIAELGDCQVQVVPIPHDCTDGFHGAYWRRPHAYLDPLVRAGISTYALLEPDQYQKELRRLEADLNSGVWDARHRDLAKLDAIDLGYRLIVADCRSKGDAAEG